jgi:hypothetical protein
MFSYSSSYLIEREQGAEGAKDSETPLRVLGYLSWVGAARLGKQLDKPDYNTMSDEKL